MLRNIIEINQNIYLEISSNVDISNVDYYTNFDIVLIIKHNKYKLLNENILYIKNINEYILDNRLLK